MPYKSLNFLKNINIKETNLNLKLIGSKFQIEEQLSKPPILLKNMSSMIDSTAIFTMSHMLII